MTKEVLKYPDGRKVVFCQEGVDEQGEYLIVEHKVMTQGAMNGPHWHPQLCEKFTVLAGKIRFVVDQKEMVCSAGDVVTVQPKQVHQFWNEGEEELRIVHEIRPPGQHWRMFELLHYLECAGKMNEKGIPKNPLWMGVLWQAIDGYIVGPPNWLQRIVFGGLAWLAQRIRLTNL